MAKLSKSVLERLITLDIAEAVTDSITASAPEGGKVEDGLAEHLEAAKLAKQNCFKELTNGKDEFGLEPKEYERYKKALIKVRAIIKEEWPKECPAEAFTALAIELTERVRDRIKKNKRWIALIDAQFGVYKFYDPNLNLEYAEAIEDVAAKIRSVLRGG